MRRTGILLAMGLVLIGLAAALVLSHRQGAAREATVAYDKPITAAHEWRTERAADSGSSFFAGSEGVPVLDLEDDFYDFGLLRVNKPVSREFSLTNRGSAPLFIKRAYTTCGCTTAEFSASIIPPGKTSLVTIRFDPGQHDSPGLTIRRGLIIETNDPSRPMAEIWIEARLR